MCRHTTGHAETVLVELDPKIVSYETRLNVLFKKHDRTTKNYQGPDVGDQYRSAIFTFSAAQDAAARAAMAREATALKHEVVTEIGPLVRFWEAEEYHQRHDEKIGSRGCPTPQGLPAPEATLGTGAARRRVWPSIALRRRGARRGARRRGRTRLRFEASSSSP